MLFVPTNNFKRSLPCPSQYSTMPLASKVLLFNLLTYSAMQFSFELRQQIVMYGAQNVVTGTAFSEDVKPDGYACPQLAASKLSSN